MANLELRNVKKVYGKSTQVLHGLDLSVTTGEFIVLVGPSGCGKSTLLRILAGLETVTSGEILIDDQVINDLAPKDRNIAMVFQDYALYPHMSVKENLEFGLRNRKIAKEQIAERVKEAVRILHIEDLLDRKPSQLSGGQRQRVAIGRTIVRKPSVFLFDEPLSNLDAQLRGETRIEIADLHNRVGATTVYVTHDQVEAMTLADRIVLLNQGIIQQVGAPMELYKFPANKFVAGFIGSPQINLIDGTIQLDGDQPYFSFGSHRIPVDKKALPQKGVKDVTAGLRPEDVQIALDSSMADIEAHLLIVEPHGHETHFILELEGGKRIIARVSGPDHDEIQERFGEGKPVPVHFRGAHWLWFDTEPHGLRIQ